MNLKSIGEVINKKFKKDKKTAIITLIGFSLMFAILVSEFLPLNSDEKTDDTKVEYSDYCQTMESKIEAIVQSIDGAGEAQVMITLAETTEYIYAKNVDFNSNEKDNNSNSEYIIINIDDNDTGLLVKTIEPKIRGVAIVCEGGDNPTVQQQIYSAVSVVLNINTSKISISKLSSSEAKK